MQGGQLTGRLVRGERGRKVGGVCDSEVGCMGGDGGSEMGMGKRIEG